MKIPDSLLEYACEFRNNEPDYIFGDIRFIGTCGSFPEQYDLVIKHKDTLYQVGYVRLRGGRLRAAFCDCLGEVIYYEEFDEKFKGSFDSEEERVFHLVKIADAVMNKLNKLKEIE